MKLTKTLAGLLLMTIVFAGAVSVEAGHFGRHHGHQGMMGPGIRALKTIVQLNLSDSQKSQILSIIDKYENERDSLKRRLREEREEFNRIQKAETFNEIEVRDALRRTAPIKEELQVMRLRMMAELKTVLTPEQRQLFKELRAQRKGWMRARGGACLEEDGSN